jgi:hypothetical protein
VSAHKTQYEFQKYFFHNIFSLFLACKAREALGLKIRAFLIIDCLFGEHITDTYITETDTTEPENLSHNIIDIFIIET